MSDFFSKLLADIFSLALVYLFFFSCDRAYRWLMKKLGKARPLRSLYPLEKLARLVFGTLMATLIIFWDYLSSVGLALRPNLAVYPRNVFILLLFLWLGLVLNRRLQKWSWEGLVVIYACLVPIFGVIWFSISLESNSFEYDIVKEGDKVYLHTSEQASWHDHYVHKYEVVNDFFVKVPAVDYDIHQVSERLFDVSYEEQKFVKEDEND